MASEKGKSDKVFVRPREVDDGRGGRARAPIPRVPGTDVTRGRSGERSRHAIADAGEWVLLTPYIRRLLRRGELERAKPAEPKPAEPKPAERPRIEPQAAEPAHDEPELESEVDE